MNIKPMIFNTEMVRALLDGRKLQTRRPMPEWQKPKKNVSGESGMEWISIAQRDARWGFALYGNTEDECMSKYTGWLCPFAAPGDLIYVRETFRRFDSSNECGCSEAPCGCPRTGTPIYFSDCSCSESKWTPSIHMPRWASRLTLKVTGVRVERVQDISEADACLEGITSRADQWRRDAFKDTWQTIYGDSWEHNDWVWVIDFEVIRQNVDEYLKKQERAA